MAKDNSMLARKQQELEETLSATEREFSNAISDHKDIQNKLKDEVRSLSQGLQSREQECADLKIRLSDSEGRASGLEVELSKTEQDRRDVEYKLGALYSALRRTLGISRMGRSASPMRGKQSRSPSPMRNQRNRRLKYTFRYNA